MTTSPLNGLEILVIEDESLLRKHIAAHLQSLGADVTGAASLHAAREAISNGRFDFALLDINLPDGRGTALLQDKTFSPNTAVIVMTAEGDVSSVIDTMRRGALDYLVKPFDVAELPLVIARARRARQATRLQEHRRASEAEDAMFFGAALSEVKDQLDRIVAADGRMREHLPPVLIEGETGTGKTALARWLHHHGPRGDQPLVEVNCPAVPETLAESELFGHERGAFTDARTARMGLFEAANGGTLFLDELPSLSLGLQAKVLKAVEDHRIRRVGGTREIPIDVRVVAATNRDLRQLASTGHFREDLLHRLDLYRIRIPPLRERGEDVAKLADLLLGKLYNRHRLPTKKLSNAGKRRLQSYPWPGNVRELAHELERSIVFESGDELSLERLNLVQPMEPGVPGGNWFNPGFRFPEQGFDLEKAISHLVSHALNQTGNNVSAAARLLGVTRDYVRYRLAAQKSEVGHGERGE
jgi:DNA-binding NtrC family response regulator